MQSARYLARPAAGRRRPLAWLAGMALAAALSGSGAAAPVATVAAVPPVAAPAATAPAAAAPVAAPAAAVAAPIPGPHVWTPSGRLSTAVPLQVHQGRLAIPLRDLAEAAGAAVTWHAATRRVQVTRGPLSLELAEGDTAAAAVGQPMTLAFAPYLQGSSLMVPARDVLAALAVPFRWDGTGLWLEVPAPRPAAGRQLELDDAGYGLRMVFPDPWQLRGDLAPAVLVLERPGARVEITTDQLRPASVPAVTMAYSNRSIDRGWNGIRRLLAGETRVGGYRAWHRVWERPALPLAEDRRRYAQWDVFRPDRVVTTLTLKATDAAWEAAYAEARAMVGSLAFRAPAWGHTWHRTPGAHRDEWVRWQQQGRLRWSTPPPGQPMWGLFDPAIGPGAGFEPGGLHRIEAELGARFPVVMTYEAIGKPFPTEMIQQLIREGHLVMLTLQPWEPTDPYYAYENGSSLTFRILRGEFDEYFRQYARAMAALGEPLLFRYANEMNGDWSPWSAFQLGRDPDLYVEEWRHIRRVFAEEGAGNAAWVWNPHDVSFPYLNWNHAVRYYPGDEWVDWVGMTGYNVGDAYPGSQWRGFREIYGPLYAEYTALFPGKPFIITEFASHDSPGDKAAWMREVAAALPEYPNIRMAVWWNGTDGNRRYRFDSSPESLAAFRAAVTAPYLSDTVRWVPDGPPPPAGP